VIAAAWPAEEALLTPCADRGVVQYSEPEGVRDGMLLTLTGSNANYRAQNEPRSQT